MYIGNSSNYYYSSFDNVQVASTIIGDPNLNFELTNEKGDKIFISKQKALSLVKKPTSTFYVFTQKHILETLIPEYEQFIFNFENGLAVEDEENGFTIARYKEDIKQWKKVIIENEKSKFLAKNEREKYKASLTNIVNNFNYELETIINNSDDPVGESNLNNMLSESNKIKDLLNEYFEDNISFDAGVGEISRGVESIVINETSNEFNLTVDESISKTFGGIVGGFGVIATVGAFFQQDINTALNTEDETTERFSYTLKDNDKDNLFSIDVINSFDGNGPIFSTKGGRTSCPYEGQEESKFFTEDEFKTYFSSYFSQTAELNTYEIELITVEGQLESQNNKKRKSTK